LSIAVAAVDEHERRERAVGCSEACTTIGVFATQVGRGCVVLTVGGIFTEFIGSVGDLVSDSGKVAPCGVAELNLCGKSTEIGYAFWVYALGGRFLVHSIRIPRVCAR
jgi:hypothetical protein